MPRGSCASWVCFRALGFLGPPLLDGIGRPELTLRYMVIATIAVPASFCIGAKLLGRSLGFLSVAVAWALGYPIAFAVLSYLVDQDDRAAAARLPRGQRGASS